MRSPNHVSLATCTEALTYHKVRNAHIYGIDLASPSELIAHERNDEAIAKHIGADKVIFQKLEDLEDACASAFFPGSEIQKDRKFEVGVFNGKYITPVDEDYFRHLEIVRGQSKRMKVVESALQAVANGSAGTMEIQIATNGATVEDGGEVVPTSLHRSAEAGDNANDDSHRADGKRKRGVVEEEDTPPPKDRMDISLHNFNDERE